MSDSENAKNSFADPLEERLKTIGHPRGTLAIVLIYAGLFALGWLGLYVGTFLGRGAPH